MSRPRQPAFQFYSGDWLKDPQLSACSLATRGFWIDCVAAMWENSRSGKLSGTDEQIARICRCTAKQVRESVAELKSTGAATVRYRNGRVTITNRRMAKDAKARAQNASRQARHRQGKASNAPVAPEKRRSHTPSSSSTTSTSVETPLPPALDTPRFRAAWAEWEKHRREIKKTLKPTTRDKQLAKLAKWGEGRAIAALEHSMENGWTGIFEPKDRPPDDSPEIDQELAGFKTRVETALDNTGYRGTQAGFAISAAQSREEVLAVYRQATGEDYADA